MLINRLTALMSLAVAFSGLFALGTQSVEAKSAHSTSHIAHNYFVPPPPPYTPSILSWTAPPPGLLMTSVQAAAAAAHNQSAAPQVGQHNPYLNIDPVAESKIQKHIDSIDSEISTKQEEIGKLLNL